MKRMNLLLSIIIIVALGGAGCAQTTLLQDLTSKMPSGAAFTAQDTSGTIYKGHLITHPARRLLRRGTMVLVFDAPIVPVTADPEGVIRAGNKTRMLKLGASLAAAKLADDAVDGAIGASKARYIGAAISAALIIFQKGGEAKLHAGDTIEIEPRRTQVPETGVESQVE